MGLTPIQIIRHFKKSGGLGEFTKPLEEFPPEIRRLIGQKLAEIKAEAPVIAYWRAQDEWLFVCADCLVFPIPKGPKTIKYLDIQVSTPHPDKETFFYEKDRANLSIKTMSGAEFIIPIEAGRSTFGLWHTICRVNG